MYTLANISLIILKPTVRLRSSLIDEFMNWYNFIRPHGAFDIKRLETPAMIFYKGLPKKEIVDQSFFDMLERGCNNLGIKQLKYC